MPKLDPKTVQRELEQGQVWPVYWLFGLERMKSRELVKRIRKAVLGDESGRGNLLGLGEETLDANEVSAEAIVDAAQSPALGGGTRLVIVKDAHALKSPDPIEVLLGPRGTKESFPGVCVFLSKDLDGRKKFSKILLEKAAVVPCEDVGEGEREAWIDYLAKRRGVKIGPEAIVRLGALDPWTLDIIDQELEKFALASQTGPSDEVLGGSAVAAGGSETFLDSFFSRNLKGALSGLESFANQTDETLPLLGLIGWNVRHLVLLLGEKKAGRRSTVKLNPFVAEKLGRWTRLWSLEEALCLQEELVRIDHDLKQTPLEPLGLWTALVMRFCR